MLGSPEYRLRLARMCGTSAPKLPASLYDWQSANRFAPGVLLHNALNLAKLCGSQKAIQKVTSYKQNAAGPRAFIGITGEVTKVLHGKLDGTCRAMITYLEAAARSPGASSTAATGTTRCSSSTTPTSPG